ncbi:MAG: ATP-grasp domain-containing protein [Hyphomicrobium sp.]
MTSTVLIAAFSGRALAQSARRAGFIPLVADAFGDLDTRHAAHDFRAVNGAMQTGFRAKNLIAALDALVAAAPSKPIGLVLGSGLEDKPRLVDILDRRYGILGCNVEALQACKDPRIFFPVLDELGIAHPQTSIAVPQNSEGWLSKRIGGSGGRHIRQCTSGAKAKPRRYFQKQMQGARISVHALVACDGISTGMSRQWASPSPAQPFRYGGAVAIDEETTPAAPAMLSAVDKLSRALDLKGMASFDFIVDGGVAHLLEVNPRASATLDIFDDDQGTLFAAHIAAAQGKPLERRGSDSAHFKAAAILHADRGALTLGKFDWPSWTADQGAAGTEIPAGAPLATVLATADTSDAAAAAARVRLAELESLIYESSKT